MIELKNHTIPLPKTEIFYDDMLSPDMIRLVSEKLCIDHLINTHASCQQISYQELIKLYNTKLFDKILFVGANLYLKYPAGCTESGNDIEKIDGRWLDMDNIILIDERNDIK